MRSSYPRSEARTRCNIKGEGFSAVFAKFTTKLMEAALNKAYHRVCFGDRQEVARWEHVRDRVKSQLSQEKFGVASSSLGQEELAAVLTGARCSVRRSASLFKV